MILGFFVPEAVRSEESQGIRPATPSLALRFDNEEHKQNQYRQPFNCYSREVMSLNAAMDPALLKAPGQHAQALADCHTDKNEQRRRMDKVL
ncbi:MAG: hypothetical protein ACK46L_09355 [Synechococcaceae cyanobacterium]